MNDGVRLWPGSWTTLIASSQDGSLRGCGSCSSSCVRPAQKDGHCPKKRALVAWQTQQTSTLLHLMAQLGCATSSSSSSRLSYRNKQVKESRFFFLLSFLARLAYSAGLGPAYHPLAIDNHSCDVRYVDVGRLFLSLSLFALFGVFQCRLCRAVVVCPSNYAGHVAHKE